jgi:hypothetical protein
MPTTFLLAHLYAQSSLSRVAYSAQPGAPVLPYEPRRRRGRRGRPALVAFRGRFAGSAPPTKPVECAPVT